ncbi:MAG: hypothetical protein U0176_12550 [Bacteroidia bacterium]
MKWLRISCLLIATCLATSAAFAQGETPVAPEPILPAPAPVQEGPQFGVRFGYQLQFPSKNIVGVQNYTFFEAGHHIGYGAFVNLRASNGVQFSPYVGLEHVFWPKSEGYSGDCTLDSFPTFMGVADSLPGRDFRFFNIAFEPAFKFYVKKMSLFVKLQPMFSINLQRKVEQYNHACGVVPNSQFVDYEGNSSRGMSKFTFSLGGGIVKEVKLPRGSYLSLEPGVKIMLTKLLHVTEVDQGLDFSLYPMGLYLNLSFFRD